MSIELQQLLFNESTCTYLHVTTATLTKALTGFICSKCFLLGYLLMAIQQQAFCGGFLNMVFLLASHKSYLKWKHTFFAGRISASLWGSHNCVLPLGSALEHTEFYFNLSTFILSGTGSAFKLGSD